MAALFDDGIVEVYNTTNTAENGLKPKPTLSKYDQFAFGYENTGVIRYYEAKKADSQIDETIRIYQDRKIRADQVAVINGEQFRIEQAQHTNDDDGIRITVLSLSHLNEVYEYAETD